MLPKNGLKWNWEKCSWSINGQFYLRDSFCMQLR